MRIGAMSPELIAIIVAKTRSRPSVPDDSGNSATDSPRLAASRSP